LLFFALFSFYYFRQPISGQAFTTSSPRRRAGPPVPLLSRFLWAPCAGAHGGVPCAWVAAVDPAHPLAPVVAARRAAGPARAAPE